MKHYGVYGIIEKEDKILLIKKTRGPYLGMYCLPGGRIENSETELQALKREILEETGIEISNVKLVANFVITVHYFEKKSPKTLEHHCCNYKILNFDESNFQSDIFDQDVNGSI